MNATTKTMNFDEFSQVKSAFAKSIQGRYDAPTHTGKIQNQLHTSIILDTEVSSDDEEDSRMFVHQPIVYWISTEDASIEEANRFLSLLGRAYNDVENFEYTGWELVE